MLKEEYLEIFLLPLLNRINSEDVLKEAITQDEIRDLGKSLQCEQTDEYLETVEKDHKQSLNAGDIPDNLKRIFLALIIGTAYNPEDFFVKEEQKKFFYNIKN